MGNHLWHYSVTGPAIEEAISKLVGALPCCFTSGSAGLPVRGLLKVYPGSKMAVSEALNALPSLLTAIGITVSGIGDKHVPWVHNVNTDMVIAIDDEDSLNLLRLFNEERAGNI